MPNAARIATASALREAATEATERDYNRRLSEQLLDRLDPDGINVLYVLMLHEHAQGELVAPHYRCRALLKLLDQHAPAMTIIDVPMHHFDSWPHPLQGLGLEDPSPGASL